MITRTEADRKAASMIAERDSFISHWTELSQNISPRSSRFFTMDRNKGDKRNQSILNDTATDAQRTLSSGMMGGLTSPARPWFNLRVADPAANKVKSIKVWLDDVRRIMSDVLLKSNVYQILPMVYDDLGCYGTSSFILVEDDESVIRCHHAPIGSFAIGTSHRGSVDSWLYQYERNQFQLVKQFADHTPEGEIKGQGKVSDRVWAAYQSNQEAVYTSISHLIFPNPNFKPGSPRTEHKKWISLIFDESDKDRWLEEAGFDEFPVMAARWWVTGEDIYATKCPGMQSLPDIKQLQIMEKRKLQALEKLVNPPVTAPTSLMNSTVSTVPGGITWVDVSQGQQGVQAAYQINPHLQEIELAIREVERRINRSFFADMFLAISNMDRSGVTATEINERREEKMLILGPVLERLNDELFDPLIKRVFNIMLRKGLVPEPPQEMQGQMLAIEYISVMATAQKLPSIVGLEKFTQFTGNIMQAFPQAADRYDVDASLDSYGEAVGVDPRVIRDIKEANQIRTAKAKQTQMAAGLQAAQAGATTAKTLADTPITPDSALGAMIQRLQGGVPA